MAAKQVIAKHIYDKRQALSIQRKIIRKEIGAHTNILEVLCEEKKSAKS